MKAILIAALAGLCWGIGELCTKSVLHSGRIGPLTAIAVRSTVALPVIWLVWLVAVRAMQTEAEAGGAGEPGGWLHAPRPVLLKLILGSGLAAGAAGMILFYLALSLGEISRVKPMAFTVAPATAVLLGWLILGETMTPRKLAGVVAVLMGIVLLTAK